MAKIELQDFVYFGQLFELYGKLLSADRQQIMTDYFTFNMTLAEIAQNRKISRQAVSDAVDKSCIKLESFEQKLGFLKFKKKTQSLLQQISQTCSDEKTKQKVEKFLGEE